jgi:hypothetical protein
VTAAVRTPWILVPREHGAWGLLFQPFLAAAILGKRWDPYFVPAALLVLTVFVVREPLLILARQRWVWRVERPESQVARRCLAWQVPLTLVLAVLLAGRLPLAPLLLLGTVAAGLTALAVWMALHNRQRSIPLQAASSLGLGVGAVLAALVATGGIPVWTWRLWAVLSLHSLLAILVVHWRLDVRQGREVPVWAPWIAAAPLLPAGLLAWSGHPRIGAAVALSVMINAGELLRLRSPASREEPLVRVGIRTLAASLAHTAATVAALW